MILNNLRRKYLPVPITNVTIEDSFWSPRISVNRTETIPYLYKMFREGGRFDVYEKDIVPGDDVYYKIYWDSEIGKWIESASYSIAVHYEKELDILIDKLIGMLVSIQQPDGYLNAYHTFVKPGERWTNLFTCHELYNAGTLIEAAVAHFQATGKRTLLDPVCKFVDHIASVFGTEPGKKLGYDGHPGIEMALGKLYQLTGNRKYLELEWFFVNERGKIPNYFDQENISSGSEIYWVQSLMKYYKKKNRNLYEYNQSHMLAREQREAVGHAVRAVFLYTAMTDLVMEYEDEEMFEACRCLWKNVHEKKMYITGGIGSEYNIEGFGENYFLPNESAYAETCASVGLIFWNHRLLQIDCNRRYSDVIERILYNIFPASVSLDGKKFFYENLLKSNGSHTRSGGFVCACCPPNVTKIMASLGSYIYMSSEGELVVHQYIQSTARVLIHNTEIVVRQESNYPWDGKIQLYFSTPHPVRFVLALRIPGWCNGAEFSINGDQIDECSSIEKGYMRLDREWMDGDIVDTNFPMPVEIVRAHPLIVEDAGFVALQRGPVVYCLEEADNPIQIGRISIPENAGIDYHYNDEVLGGITVINVEAQVLDDSDWGDELYRTKSSNMLPYKATAVPYCVWNNRKPGQMAVWIRSHLAM